MSHNPPDSAVLDLYDRLGMVVMDENRLFSNDTQARAPGLQIGEMKREGQERRRGRRSEAGGGEKVEGIKRDRRGGGREKVGVGRGRRWRGWRGRRSEGVVGGKRDMEEAEHQEGARCWGGSRRREVGGGGRR